MNLELGGNRVRERRGSGEKHGLRVHIVFGLGEHVRGDPGGGSRIVGDDQHLGRACRYVDTHFAEYQPFRGGNELVSRAYNHIDGRNAFRSVGHGGYRLRAAGGEYPVYTAEGGNRENPGITVRCIRISGRMRNRRGTENNRITTGGLRRGHAHDHARKKRKPAAGHVDSGTFHRQGLLSGNDPGNQFGFKGIERLFLTERELHGEIPRMAERPIQFGVFIFQGFFGGAYIVGGYFEPGRVRPVKLRRVVPHSRIATFAYRGENARGDTQGVVEPTYGKKRLRYGIRGISRNNRVGHGSSLR